MKIKYKIYRDKNLMIDILEGDISLSDLEKMFQQEINNPDFRHVNRILSDITNAETNMSVKELQKFISFIIPPTPETN
jgi:hypothetical protein